jgi:tetratricopeptide (TPR) repeat protein
MTRDADTDDAVAKARALLAAGRLAEADRLLRPLAAAEPDNGAVLAVLAEVRLAEAPGEPLAHVLMAHAERLLGRPRRAAEAARRALERDPANAAALNLLGLCLRDLGDLDAAVETFRRAADAEPGTPDLWHNLAKALTESERHEEAVHALEKALALRPGNAKALLSLGNALRALGRLDQAIAAYRRGLATDSVSASLHSNLAVTLQQCADFDAARAHFEAAIEAEPALVTAHHNLAILDLLCGRFAAGFDRFEWRWRKAGEVNRRRPFPQPEWDGAPLAGRTVLVWSEQGVGDEIMFASLLPEVIAIVRRCLIECEPRLVPLFARSFPEAEVFARLAPPDARLLDRQIEVQASAGGLCRWRRRSRDDFPPPAPFLRAEPRALAEIRERYAALGPGPKVGLAWRSKTPLWGAIKSAPLALWEPILSIPGVQWINLQYGDCAGDLAQVRARLGVTVHHDPEVDQMADLDAFAAQVAALDLVVTTSNTTAHMAGALAVPCWVMLAHVPDWRWQVAGERPLWYARMRLYRQPVRGDWAGPIAEVAEALAERAGGAVDVHQ